MDELKLLVELVKDLPTMAIWVLVGFYSYKVIIIGSIFKVITLGITKIHSIIDAYINQPIVKDIHYTIENMALNPYCDMKLLEQLHRLVGRTTGAKSIGSADIDWLKAAIDNKITKDIEDSLEGVNDISD